MSDKKLLNLTFTSRTTGRSINIGADSQDNISKMQNVNEHYISNKNPLNQIGCQIIPTQSLYRTAAYDLSIALNRAGYGNRNLIPKNAEERIDIYYLNVPDYDYMTDNVPYLKYNTAGVLTINYDGVIEERGLFQLIQGGGRGAPAYCGKLYADGTFTGDAIVIYPHEITTNIYSKKNYEWSIYNETYKWENYQIINEDIIEVLSEFIPVEPEGEYITEGYGDYNNNSDEIPESEIPSNSALSTGLISIYKLNAEQMNNFSNYLYSDLFDTASIKKLFSDPLQVILSCGMLPVNTSDTSIAEIKLGMVNSGVEAEKLHTQYVKINFGTLNINEYWASFSDYSPYTDIDIYLPFSGVHTLNTDDIMNGTLTLYAYVDIMNGNITYQLKSVQTNRAGHSHNAVLYTYTGNCLYGIPLSETDFSATYNAIIKGVSTVAGGLGTGGISTAISASGVADLISNTVNAKPKVSHNGTLTGSNGLFSILTPFIIINRPEIQTVTEYEHLVGRPSNEHTYISSLSGYNVIRGVDVEKIENASESEKNQIEQLLKGGIII